MKLRIRAGGASFEVVLRETPTAKALLEAVPFESRVQTWGEEGDALALPYGRTPISTDERPKLAARCNVVGRLENPADLAKIRSGEKISVSRA